MSDNPVPGTAGLPERPRILTPGTAAVPGVLPFAPPFDPPSR
jgi:hypothetical protein